LTFLLDLSPLITRQQFYKLGDPWQTLAIGADRGYKFWRVLVMAESLPYRGTPKRKRDAPTGEQSISPVPIPVYPTLTKTFFSFEPPKQPSDGPLEDGDASPRTKVAQKFRGLVIGGSGGGGGATPITTQTTDRSMNRGKVKFDPAKQAAPDRAVFDFHGASKISSEDDNMIETEDDDQIKRKRARHSERDLQITPGNHGESSAEAAGPVQVGEDGRLHLQTRGDPATVKVKSGGSGKLQKSYPSINRLSESKSRSRRRTGTPPLSSKRKKHGMAEEEEPVIVDPVRAALTWHEDEITVYDSEDKDDDGTGLNGIGFRPTPAIAYQRSQKRRQQMAEYRKREEAEARARRNQRRREQLGEAAEMDGKNPLAKVRFSDSEPAIVVTN
jgi:hypothetical protein